ncbi:MAG: hypothetical protein AAF211_21275, partial [Myxococcota bacterium]
MSDPDDPERRSTGGRRVVGARTVARLLARRERRVGSSSGFWSRIEDDDPFDPDVERTASTRGAPPAGSPSTPEPQLPRPRDLTPPAPHGGAAR